MGYRNDEVTTNYEMARSLRDRNLFDKLSQKKPKSEKCKKIVSDNGAVQSAHPYSNDEDWCIKIVTSCDEIHYEFGEMNLDNCENDQLSFEYDGKTISFCTGIESTLRTNAFFVHFKSDNTGTAHGFDFTWSCDQPQPSSTMAPTTTPATTTSTTTTTTTLPNTTNQTASLAFTALAEVDPIELQKAKKVTQQPADFADAAGLALSQVFNIDEGSTERVSHAQAKLVRLVQQIAKGVDRRGKLRDCVKADQWGQANLNKLVDLNLTVDKLRELMGSYIDHRFGNCRHSGTWAKKRAEMQFRKIEKLTT